MPVRALTTRPRGCYTFLEYNSEASDRMGLKAIVKKNRAVYRIANVVRKLPYPLIRAYMAVCHALCGVDPEKVYFSSFTGKLYNENPKYVCEALHEIAPDAKIVFRLNAQGMRQSDVPGYVRRVRQYSPKAMYHMATARVVVKNAALLPYMRTWLDQTYIQLWHGDRGLKKICLDMENADPKKCIDRFYMQLGVCGSDFGRDIYMRRAFGYTGELLECGYPKNDLLIANPSEIARDVRAELGIDPGAKALLYAPTFRQKETGSAAKANFSMNALRGALEESTGEKWVTLTRGHTLNTGVRSDGDLDVSDFPDVSRLLLITDMLITDYSSIAGDFLLLNRPIILYHADRGAYERADRSLLFDPDQSPYRVAHDQRELIDIACHFGDAAENCRALYDFYGTKETGRASETVARRIAGLIGEKKA